MKTNSEIQISISENDMNLIKSTCKQFNIISCWITFDKNNHIKELYKFQPKGKSFYINIENN